MPSPQPDRRVPWRGWRGGHTGPCAQPVVPKELPPGRMVLEREVLSHKVLGARPLTLGHGGLEDHLALQVLGEVPSPEEEARLSLVVQSAHLGHLQEDLLLLSQALCNLLVLQSQSFCEATGVEVRLSGLFPRSRHWGAAQWGWPPGTPADPPHPKVHCSLHPTFARQGGPGPASDRFP